MLVFVMFALYLSLSLHFSKYRIQDTLKKHDLPETIFVYNRLYEDDELFLQYYDMESLNIKEYVEEQGHTYTSIPTFYDDKLRLETISSDNYKVISGKELNELEDFELAISKEYAQTLGDNVIGQSIEFLGFELSIQSIIEYPNYELAYQPLETLSQADLFEEGMLGTGIVTEFTLDTIQDDYWSTYVENLDEDVYFVVPDYHLLKIKFDNFTFDKERELLNNIAKVNVTTRIYDNILSIDSLTILTQSNPLIEMLKSSISKFVVGMIVLSSTYAFYIHLKNELHSKRKTLGTLNLVGVSFKHVVNTYLMFFYKVIYKCISNNSTHHLWTRND